VEDFVIRVQQDLVVVQAVVVWALWEIVERVVLVPMVVLDFHSQLVVQ
jgi:hypothetical protein